MKGKDCILYFHPKATTFIKRDLEMLSKNYEVINFTFHSKSKVTVPWLLLKQLLFIIRYLPGAQISFCMFSGYHSFLPALFSKLFKKPFVVILGGTDSVVIPSIGYGILRKPLIRRFAKWSYQLTKYYAPVHKSLISSSNTYSEMVPEKQGIRNHFPNLKIEYKEIPNGFNTEVFIDKNQSKISQSFITVAFDLDNPRLFKLKGVDLIMEIAPDFPDCSFTIVGLENYPNAPANVKLIKSTSQQELIQLYNEHEFYLQLSLTEGFPNALCEAMSCGCIPLVSNVAAMPKIVEGVGFVLNKRDPGALKYLISKYVLNADREELRQRSRSRIVTNFGLQKRSALFDDFIAELKG